MLKNINYFIFVGSFAHVHSKDEVLESVLKYIAVLARPLVLQAEKHPVTWSHTFMDISVSENFYMCNYELLVVLLKL